MPDDNLLLSKNHLTHVHTKIMEIVFATYSIFLLFHSSPVMKFGLFDNISILLIILIFCCENAYVKTVSYLKIYQIFVLFFLNLKILENIGSCTKEELFVILKKISESDESSIIQFPDHIIKLVAQFSGLSQIFLKNFFLQFDSGTWN